MLQQFQTKAVGIDGIARSVYYKFNCITLNVLVPTNLGRQMSLKHGRGEVTQEIDIFRNFSIPN